MFAQTTPAKSLLKTEQTASTAHLADTKIRKRLFTNFVRSSNEIVTMHDIIQEQEAARQ